MIIVQRKKIGLSPSINKKAFARELSKLPTVRERVLDICIVIWNSHQMQSVSGKGYDFEQGSLGPYNQHFQQWRELRPEGKSVFSAVTIFHLYCRDSLAQHRFQEQLVLRSQLVFILSFLQILFTLSQHLFFFFFWYQRFNW